MREARQRAGSQITAKDDGNVFSSCASFCLMSARLRRRLRLWWGVVVLFFWLWSWLLLLQTALINFAVAVAFSHLSALPFISATNFSSCLIFVFHFSFCTALIWWRHSLSLSLALVLFCCLFQRLGFCLCLGLMLAATAAAKASASSSERCLRIIKILIYAIILPAVRVLFTPIRLLKCRPKGFALFWFFVVCFLGCEVISLRCFVGCGWFFVWAACVLNNNIR